MPAPFGRFDGRYLFIAGLHRSGTSILTRLIAEHPDIAAIVDAPVPENEGCYLQGAIPHTAQDGRPGHYATDPAQHLIEGCGYDRLDVRIRMEADWARWFSPGGRWRVEKSPVNLVRMRLYQQIFPTSQFIVILRHPEALAAAMEKWVDTPFADRIDYVCQAYDRVMADARFLHAKMIIRYEDLVADPSRHLAAVDAFLDLEPRARAIALDDGNARYRGSPVMDRGQAVQAARYGYLPGLGTAGRNPIVTHPWRAVAGRCAELLGRD